MQLRKLKASDHTDVIQLFGEDLTYYHFLTDGLERHNYEGSYRAYGEFEDERLVSLLVNNGRNITYFASTDRDIHTYATLLEELEFSKLSGPNALMEKFLPYVDAKTDTLSYLGVVLDPPSTTGDHEIHSIESAQEIGLHYDLLSSTAEYRQHLPLTKEEYVQAERERLGESASRTMYVERAGEMLAACTTLAEDERSAIVIGVVTAPNHRKMGYGTEVLNALFRTLLSEGKYPYLFYNNPAARSLYKKLGMTEVCEWRVLTI